MKSLDVLDRRGLGFGLSAFFCGEPDGDLSIQPGVTRRIRQREERSAKAHARACHEALCRKPAKWLPIHCSYGDCLGLDGGSL
jgi:hypothetical protein